MYRVDGNKQNVTDTFFLYNHFLSTSPPNTPFCLFFRPASDFVALLNFLKKTIYFQCPVTFLEMKSRGKVICSTSTQNSGTLSYS